MRSTLQCRSPIFLAKIRHCTRNGLQGYESKDQSSRQRESSNRLRLDTADERAPKQNYSRYGTEEITVNEYGQSSNLSHREQKRNRHHQQRSEEQLLATRE